MPPTCSGHERPKSVHDVLGLFRLTTVHDVLDPDTYLDEALFAQAGIKVRYADYTGYLEYQQLYPPFEHQVSVLDLILNEGPGAQGYLKDL